MTKATLSAALIACMIATTAPATAETDLGKIVGGFAQTILAQEMDKAAYIQAQKTHSVAAYQGYLKQYPNGIYRSNAQAQLKALGVRAKPATTAPSGVQTEARLGLSRSQRITIQRQLTSIGYDTGVPDGLWGSKTRAAITRWQRSQKLSQTGYVTAAQVKRIAEQARSKTAATPTASPANRDALEEKLLGLNSAERREMQLRLSLLGYDTHGTDGVFGSNTRAAIRGWQSDHGWRKSGYLTADQIRRLRRESKG